MRSRVSQFLLLGLLFAASTRIGTPQSSSTAGVCAVAGTVVNAGTRQLIRKARVSISSGLGTPSPKRPSPARTDEFEFAQPPARRLSVDGRGHWICGRWNDAPWAAVNLVAGEQRRDVILSLLPEAVISGKVLDDQGDPAISAMVYAFVPVYSNHRRRFVLTGQGGSAQTDERGDYRLYNLSPGSYTLVATYQRKDDPRPVATPPTFYPGVSDPDQSSPLTVGAGDEATDINLDLVVTQAVCVRGRATVPSQKPCFPRLSS